jgi:hypothetical protein
VGNVRMFAAPDFAVVICDVRIGCFHRRMNFLEQVGLKEADSSSEAPGKSSSSEFSASSDGTHWLRSTSDDSDDSNRR